MMSRSKFMLLSLGQQNANEVADQHLVETAIDPTILYDSPSASATPYSTGSTFSSCFTTPFSENGSLDLCSIIDARAECLTERILGGLYIVHNATSGNFVCTTNGGANSPQSSSRVSLGYPGTSAWKDPQRSDRCPLKRDREEREDEEGGDGDRPKKQNRKTVDSQAQRYACVFLKRNPAKYMHWSSCGSKGWPDTSRLK
jgi:hypothetical protein